ncbi:sperm-specific sodium:proton exchanger-like [Ambystoma mexicanum]|uniref:sperm-specific sodium:proton exchanger-like n=1 Tax=Ambystoma mexicanum TaxID=8296 RepID=UPI0037E7BE37
MAMYSIILRLQQCASTTLWILKMDRFLADANWNMVEIATFIEDPYHTSESNATLEELFPELLINDCPDCEKETPREPTPHEIADMIDEARLRMLKVQVISFWRQYNSGMLNRETTRILVNVSESYVDRKGKFMNIHEVKKCWETKGLFVFIRKRVEALVYRVKEEAVRPSPFIDTASTTVHELWGNRPSKLLETTWEIKSINVLMSVLKRSTRELNLLRALCSGFSRFALLQASISLFGEISQN